MGLGSRDTYRSMKKKGFFFSSKNPLISPDLHCQFIVSYVMSISPKFHWTQQEFLWGNPNFHTPSAILVDNELAMETVYLRWTKMLFIIQLCNKFQIDKLCQFFNENSSLKNFVQDLYKFNIYSFSEVSCLGWSPIKIPPQKIA